MGDSLRGAAFDAAYGILGDVGEAEDCATEALAHAEGRGDTVGNLLDSEAWVVREAADVTMARIRRARRGLAALGAVAAVLFVVAAAVAEARSGERHAGRGVAAQPRPQSCVRRGAGQATPLVMSAA